MRVGQQFSSRQEASMSSAFVESARNRARSVRKGGRCEARKDERLTTVHALVTPSVWRAEVTLALNSPSTTTPVRLVLRVITPRTLMISTSIRLDIQFATNSLLYQCDLSSSALPSIHTRVRVKERHSSDHASLVHTSNNHFQA